MGFLSKYIAIVYLAVAQIMLITECQTYSSLMDYYISIYGSGYGTEWIYFPDGNGYPHNVSLLESNADFIRGLFSELEFKLHTRLENKSEQVMVMNLPGSPILSSRDFNLGMRPIKVITHGWKSSVDSAAVTAIKDAYLQTQNVSVITVDWSYTADSIFYHWVANQTRSIGIEIGTFLKDLSQRYNITGDRYHLLGHSLGAHIMGVAANYSNLKIDRITGLDPARPLFDGSTRNYSEKLDLSDAVFVDVIHTCGGVLGIEEPIGTADFFPNSGTPPQPGCDSIPKIIEACSHGRSYHYFAESIINPKAFPSYQCGSWRDYLEKRCLQTGYMGEFVSRSSVGNYYTKTNGRKPFGRKN